jgi:hypothetical protein
VTAAVRALKACVGRPLPGRERAAMPAGEGTPEGPAAATGAEPGGVSRCEEPPPPRPLPEPCSGPLPTPCRGLVLPGAALLKLVRRLAAKGLLPAVSSKCRISPLDCT